MWRIVCLAVLAVSQVSSVVAGDVDWHDQVATPDPAFTQIPLWFWNDELDDDEIRRQMAEFRAHGVYGFMIHARMGLPKSIGFMSDRWLGHVRTAIEEAARTGMLVCLYDEFMYPSGSAHGEVARSNPEHAAQSLRMTVQEVDGPGRVDLDEPDEGTVVAVVAGRRISEVKTLDPATLRLLSRDQPGTELPAGHWQIMTFTQVPSGGHIRGVHEGEDDRQPDAPPAADLLNPEAMRQFIRLAYDPYDRVASEHYGKTVIGMFTDEPSMLGRGHRQGVKPWTGGLAEFFADRRGYDLLPLLPALFVDIGDRTAPIRRDFERTLTERLDETYYRPLAQWCAERNIALTGHPAHSDEIDPLRHFHIPGQDIVWRWALPNHESALEGPNSTVGKCTSSVARHDGRRRNSNELFGAYGWQLTMDEMKWLTDWLAVRGVNLFYPHAFYYSIRDSRAMERPPDVGPNNAWWPHYRPFADYTSRLCKLLTDGRHICDVAILGGENRLPWRAAKLLFEHQVDFNYIEPWRLIEQAEIVEGRLRLGDMAYGVLIIDQDDTPDEVISQRLRELAEAGVQVRYCRGAPDERLIAGIERDVRANPASPDLRYIHVQKYGIDFYLFVNEGETAIDTEVTVRCNGRAEWFDPWTGTYEMARATGVHEDAITLPLRLERRESLVLCIDPSARLARAAAKSPQQLQRDIPLEVSWRVIDPAGRTVGHELGDWLNAPDTAGFTGTLTYRTTFTCAPDVEHRYRLDLGEVGDFAVVRLNGRDLGARLWAPFAWDVTDALRAGANELVVEVTNSLANRYTPDKPRPSGLIGPVRLHEMIVGPASN